MKAMEKCISDSLVREIKEISKDKKTRLFISFKRSEDNSVLHVAVKEDSLQDSILRDILFALDETAEVCENNIPRNNFEECAEKLVKSYTEGYGALQDFYRNVIPIFRSKAESTRFVWLICSNVTFLVFEDDTKLEKDFFCSLCKSRKGMGMFVVGEMQWYGTFRILTDNFDEEKRDYNVAYKIVRENAWYLI